jgi:hydrogenase nickel incorporation protein HypB
MLASACLPKSHCRSNSGPELCQLLTIFNSADVAIITKSDLAAAVEFDEEAARRNIQAVRPGMEIFKLSAKTGERMPEYLEFLESRRGRIRAAAVV